MLLILFGLGKTSFSSLPAPKINCVSVLPSGEILLTWEAVPDPTLIFNSYTIYSVVAGVPTLLTTIGNRNQTTFSHLGIDANATSFRYIIGTTCSANITSFSDTVSSIKLRVSNPNNGLAVLNWNRIFSPNNPTASNQYLIYREYPLGTWTLIDSVNYGNEFYRDTITICDDTINYRVSVANINCVSQSSIDGDNFSDVLPPNSPYIKAVSVDINTNLATITWHKGYPEDTEAYIILKSIGGAWVPIDTVFGINNTNYTYFLSNATNESECYGIAAFDSCRYGNPLSANTSPMSSPHCTIYLETQRNVCDQTVSLTWNNYSTWQSGVLNYEIFYGINGGSFLSHSTVTGNSATIRNINPNSLYCFYVRAVSNNLFDTSFSNQTCIFSNYPFTSDTNYLQNVSVLAKNEIELKIYTPNYNTINGYTINRSMNNSPFVEIAQVIRTTNPTTYIDNNVQTNLNSYIYNVVPIDGCDNKTNKTSNSAGNILLKIDEQKGSYLNKLSWQPYATWNGNITSYSVFRILGGIPTIIATVPASINEYEDDISLFFSSSSDGQFCYYVQAQESLNQFGLSETSLSNKVCAKPSEIIYIPNSFTPRDANGLNDTFRPIIGFANYNKYSFKIYNRLGQVVFSTTEINEGWDGKYKDNFIKTDIFIYEVLIETTEGRPIKKTGHLTVF